MFYKIGLYFKDLWIKIKNSKLTEKLFLIFAIIFAFSSFFTLGNFNSLGKSYFVKASLEDKQEIEFKLNFDDDQKTLSAIYINYGVIYEPIGSEVAIQVSKRQNSLGTWTNAGVGSTTILNLKKVDDEGNVDERSLSNYNWTPLFEDLTLSSTYTSYRFILTCDMVVNEIAFVANNGTTVDCKLSRGDKNASKMIDSPKSFNKKKSSYYRFTEDEIYSLIQVDNILNSGKLQSDNAIIINKAFNSLGGLILLVGTFIFGRSTFGLRFIPFLFSFGLFILIYKFASRLFKDNKYGMVGGLIYVFSTLPFTIFRLGNLTSTVAFLTLLAFYFAFKFFSYGVRASSSSSDFSNIVYSGIFVSLALCISTKVLFAYGALLFIIGWGLVRQYKVNKKRGEEAVANAMIENKKIHDVKEREENFKQAEAVRDSYNSVNKKTILISSICAFSSFLLLAFILLIAFSSLTYKVNNLYYYAGLNASFMKVFGITFKNCFNGFNNTLLSVSNNMKPFAFFVLPKASTLYVTSYASNSSGIYQQLNCCVNIGVVFISLLSFLFSTSYVVASYFIKKDSDKELKTVRYIRRIYYFLLLGLVATFMPNLISQNNITMFDSGLFYVFYLIYILLALYILNMTTNKGENKVSMVDKITVVLLVVFSILFLMQIPSMFCISTSVVWSKCLYGWQSVVNNGYFRRLS